MTARGRERSAGILLHPTSLPGRHGIGDLGQGVDLFLDWMVKARQTLWQVLPLGPTGYGDSPYQPFSAFAGNPLLIDLTALAAQGWFTQAELASQDPFDASAVDYGKVIGAKTELLRLAWSRASRDSVLTAEIDAFAEANAHWLPDYCLFMACKIDQGWRSWTDWPRPIALRDPQALAEWRVRLIDEIGFQRFAQYLFDTQWRRVHALANALGIQIIGDLPIFVGHDSADVWSRQELFTLDEEGHPTVVAGVPPDYFSETGQLWGNPHYRWKLMATNGYAWWLARLHRVLDQVDIIRLDHFRGFAGYWEVPADEETAINGRWVKGPGKPFFTAVAQEFGGLPIIAEDLGLISSDVDALRQDLGLPGMRVLQFAFDGDATSTHLPHNYEPDTVVYTGTHDNDTTKGWYAQGKTKSHHRARIYTGGSGANIHWNMINLAMSSVADRAIVPLQDVLGLGTVARMNLPGRPHGNWCWRFAKGQLSPRMADALAQITTVTGRWVEPKANPEDDDDIDTLVYEEPAE